MCRFCQGEHPCFNGVSPSPLVKFDGSKGGNKDFRITDNKGVFYRFDDLDKTILVAGTFEKASRPLTQL